MGGETFVDVTYRGLDLGKRLKLCEVGPTTAYLEHPTPMPVGSRLELQADGGVALVVEVTRVHEQVAGAERSPGMRVKVEAQAERAASLWRSLVSCGDPVAVVVPIEAPTAGAPAEDVDTTVVEVAIPAASPPRDGEEVTIPLARADVADRSTVADRSRTEIMSAVDVEAIVATADEAPGEASGEQPTGDPDGKGKGRRKGGQGRKRAKKPAG